LDLVNPGAAYLRKRLISEEMQYVGTVPKILHEKEQKRHSSENLLSPPKRIIETNANLASEILFRGKVLSFTHTLTKRYLRAL